MNKRQFVQHRRRDWKRFEWLVNKLGRRRLSRLSAADVSEMSRLFRALANDLAIVRSRGWGRDLADYLNHLVARGHNSFYTAPPARYSRLLRFVTTDFPRVFRRNIGYFLVAATLLFVPGAISWVVIQNDPSLAVRVVPNEMLVHFDMMYGDGPTADDSLVDTNIPADSADWDEDEWNDEEWEENEWDQGFDESRTAMYGFYVRHNVGIALDCFARGILLGVGTVWTLLYNGIFLGAISGYAISQGYSERFLSFVVSHGSFELTAIAISGGAGLMLGNAILHPGDRSRIESLRVRGAEAVQVASGAAVMLVVAAIIEAYWSPSGVPVTWKYVVGGVLWLLVFLYLGLAGRGK